MCEPTTIALAAAAAAGPAIAAGFNAKAAYDEGTFASEQSAHNAAVANRNAQDAIDRGKIEAQDALARGEVNAGRIQGEGVKAEASGVAAMGASGFDVQSSSFLDLASGSRAAAELDALTVRNDAAREAWGIKTNAKREADALREQSRQLSAESERLRKKRNWEVAGTLLGGAAQVAGAAAGGGRGR